MLGVLELFYTYTPTHKQIHRYIETDLPIASVDCYKKARNFNKTRYCYMEVHIATKAICLQG